jgi:hypothetical protein
VSKDADFHQRSFLLRDRHADVLAFGEDETASFFALG